MALKEHRLYVHVGKRVRFFGLGAGEWCCIFAGLFGVVGFDALVWKTASLGAMVTLGWVLSRLRKAWVGVSPRSCLRWYVGIHWGLPSYVPRSHKREWIG